MLGNNNLSRANFAEFLEKNKLVRDGNRNVFYVGSEKWAYVEDFGNQQCRQFYDDCSAIFCGGKVVRREDCSIGAVTRITTKGLAARNTRFSEDVMQKSEFIA